MKAIIFDMDGVIIDSEPLHFQVERKLLEELGGIFDEDFHTTLVGTTDYHMWSVFKEKFNLEYSIGEMMDLKKERFIEEIHRVPLVKGFDKLVTDLYSQGYTMGLASSNNRKSVDTIIKTFSLDKYLSFSISGDDIEKGKPDPEIFLKSAEIINIPAGKCLVIEDAKNGVLAAKAAGMKCIGYRNPNSGNQDLSMADLVIDDYEALDLGVIEGLLSK